MTHWTAEVRVTLKDGIADPEGLSIADALRALGHAGVGEVRSGKLIRISLQADDRASAEAEVAEMCRRLLANPVMEVARWELTVDPEAAAIGVGG